MLMADNEHRRVKAKAGLASAGWFDVDRIGLGKLLERRGKEFVLLELVQNAWDQEVTQVIVTLEKEPGTHYAVIRVEDDDPNGFRTLEHAWTLFAESEKKGDAEKRGRYNLGEKLVLAMCVTAEIASTTGTVRFGADGRQRSRTRRKRGTVFTGRLKLTNQEYVTCCSVMGQVLPPAGIATTFNGQELEIRSARAEVEVTLPTEIADAEGLLRPSRRKTVVRVHDLRPGETGHIYEMGIPVVDTGDDYHVDVQQKVPLGLDRDNVQPSYLSAIRTVVLNRMHQQITPEQSNAAWVRDATGGPGAESRAVLSVVRARFGDKAVCYDPSDPEANKIAVSEGYTVVHSGHFSGDEWVNVRLSGALQPAGQVTPSAKVYSKDGDSPLEYVSRQDWTPDEEVMVNRYERWCRLLIRNVVTVKIAKAPKNPFLAFYQSTPRWMVLNRSKLGRRFFERGVSEDAISLCIHELGHEYSSDHLSRDYYDALTMLGARFVLATAAAPTLLD